MVVCLPMLFFVASKSWIVTHCTVSLQALAIKSEMFWHQKIPVSSLLVKRQGEFGSSAAQSLQLLTEQDQTAGQLNNEPTCALLSRQTAAAIYHYFELSDKELALPRSPHYLSKLLKSAQSFLVHAILYL